MKLSIIIPSIRTDKWPTLIESIEKACKLNSFEIIFVGPKHHDVMYERKNVKFVRDFGHPNRCQQIGLLLSEGEIVTWGSDDGLYMEDSIDNCLSLIDKENLDYLSTGYKEGGNSAVSNFSIRSCYYSGPHVNQNWYIFNVGFVKRKLLELVNFDTTFEVTCIGHADLACRIQNLSSNGKVIKDEILVCEHMEGSSGDHGPIFESQTYHDQDLFYRKYCGHNFNNVKWNDWKSNTETIWSRRFKDV